MAFATVYCVLVLLEQLHGCPPPKTPTTIEHQTLVLPLGNEGNMTTLTSCVV